LSLAKPQPFVHITTFLKYQNNILCTKHRLLLCCSVLCCYVWYSPFTNQTDS